MFSNTFRILSLLGGITRTQTVQPFSRSFRRAPPLRPFSTVEGVPAAENVGGVDNTTIFVGQLPPDLGRWEMRCKLREIFEPFGRVLSVRVATNLDGKIRRFAHVIYARREDALAAFHFGNGEARFVINKRILNVDMASGVRKPDIDVDRKLCFRNFSGNEKMLRKALSKGLNRLVDRICFTYPIAGARITDGYIQFKSARHALEGLKRLTGPKKRQKLQLDIWYAPSRPRDFDQVAPTSSSPGPPPAPNPDPLPQPLQSPPIQQQNILSRTTGEDNQPALAPIPELPHAPISDPLPKPRESAENPPLWQEDLAQIFVGCLPTWMPQQEMEERLKEMFEPFGQIKWLRVAYQPNVHEESVPFCHVEYVNSEDAKAAYEAARQNPMHFKDHLITVALTRPPKPSKTLYFRDYVGTKTSFWETVRDVKSNIERIVFFRDNTGKFSGNGHIEFDTLEHACDALPQLHGRVARNGSRLLLSYSRPRRNVIKVPKDHDENILDAFGNLCMTPAQLENGPHGAQDFDWNPS